MGTQDELRELDLSNPADARTFLRDFRFKHGGTLEMVTLDNGMKIDPHILPDDRICEVAMQIYNKFCTKPDNGIFFRETPIQ